MFCVEALMTPHPPILHVRIPQLQKSLASNSKLEAEKSLNNRVWASYPLPSLS